MVQAAAGGASGNAPKNTSVKTKIPGLGTVSLGGGLSPATAPPVKAKTAIAPVAAPVVQQLSGGGSSGGGGGGAAAAALPARPSLTDFINGNYQYQDQQNQNNLALQDFDADTAQQKAATAADQAVKEQALQQNLADAGVSNAEGEAGRGLLRSGFTEQNQDKINAQGATQDNAIQGLMTALMSSRQTARQTQAQQNQAALNTIMGTLTQQYNTGTGVA
jgi:hypothetical protein